MSSCAVVEFADGEFDDGLLTVELVECDGVLVGAVRDGSAARHASLMPCLLVSLCRPASEWVDRLDTPTLRLDREELRRVVATDYEHPWEFR